MLGSGLGLGLGLRLGLVVVLGVGVRVRVTCVANNILEVADASYLVDPHPAMVIIVPEE